MKWWMRWPLCVVKGHAFAWFPIYESFREVGICERCGAMRSRWSDE